jgi:hypothetical protein
MMNPKKKMQMMLIQWSRSFLISESAVIW